MSSSKSNNNNNLGLNAGGVSKSVWMTTKPPSFAPIRGNIITNVCVVGAGIAGLTTAYFLSKRKVPVVVLEDGELFSGESQRTTAHLMSAMDDRFFNLEKKHGEHGAQMAYQSHAEAINTIERIVSAERIDCEFARVDGFLFLGPKHNRQFLDTEFEAAQRAGVRGVTMLEHLTIGKKDVGPAIKFPQQGQFHPTKYLSGLAKAIQANGGQIYTQSKVTKIDDSSDKHHTLVDVDGGRATISAQRVVVATNAPIIDNATIYAQQAAYRSYVVALSVPKDTLPQALFWDTIDPYHYVRKTIDPNDDRREIVIVGGEDHKVGQKDDMPMRLDELERWAREKLGIEGRRVYAWSGQIQEPADMLAMIGPFAAHTDRTMIATGDSGQGSLLLTSVYVHLCLPQGITHGTIAGIMLSEMCAGHEHPWSKIYDPRRFQLSSDLLKENANVGAKLVEGWMKASDVRAASELGTGDGAVVRNGLSHAAVFRDASGDFRCFTAVCPHKGGILEWNSGEKTFDCPLHGSRFDAYGHAINGPSISDLEELSADQACHLLGKSATPASASTTTTSSSSTGKSSPFSSTTNTTTTTTTAAAHRAAAEKRRDQATMSENVTENR